MTLTATLHERMAQQVAERREMGRPLQAGDLVLADDGGVVPLVDIASAGDCIEALVEREIRRVTTERRLPQME